jgi:hypothetical protein
VRDQWNTEVQAALDEALNEMERAIGTRPSCKLDQQRAALDIILPRFTLAPRLEHFTRDAGPRPGDQRSAAVQIIRRVWKKIRAEHPDLWTYSQWYAVKMKSADSRELSEDDFAERMRRKRDARAQQEETPQATEEEAGEVGYPEQQDGEGSCGSGDDGGGRSL